MKHVEFGRDPLYIEYGRDDSLYLLSTKDAPKGEILRVKLSQPELASAKVVIKETTNTIADFQPTASGMALVYLRGGPMQFVYRDYGRDLLRHGGIRLPVEGRPGRRCRGRPGQPVAVGGLLRFAPEFDGVSLGTYCILKQIEKPAAPGASATCISASM